MQPEITGTTSQCGYSRRPDFEEGKPLHCAGRISTCRNRLSGSEELSLEAIEACTCRAQRQKPQLDSSTSRNIQRSVQIAFKKAGRPAVSPHTLRHSAATTMLEAGIPIHIVSRQLGHSSINVTADVYGHVSDDGARAAMETLGKLLNE